MVATAKIISVLYIVGLVLDMAGGYLLFKYAFPPHIPRLSGALIRQSNPDYKKEHEDNDRYEKLTKRGYVLVLIGFALQLTQAFFSFVTLLTK